MVCHLRPDKGNRSATLVPTLLLTVGCCALAIVGGYAADPSWWSARGAVLSQQVTTNNGIVTTNYVPNPYAIANQGQLKQFTAAAVREFNTDLASSGGAGSTLSNIVYTWQTNYAANGWNGTSPKPTDYQAVNVGQLKYVGNKVWSRLVAAGYTNAIPTWLAGTNAGDFSAANLGQLKEVFNFDLNAFPAPVTNLTAVSAVNEVDLSWTLPPTNTASSLIIEQSIDGVNWTPIATLTPTSTSYAAINLTGGQSYSFKVIAANASGVGATTSPSTSPSTAQNPIPGAPTQLSGGLDTNSDMALNWQPGTGIASYTIYRLNLATGTWTALGTSTTSTYTDSSYGSGGFQYRITAVNSTGAASAPSSTFPTSRYAVIDLGTNAAPMKITDSGYVLNQSQSNYPYTSNITNTYACWINGQNVPILPKTPGDLINVKDINNAGVVVGSETVATTYTYPGGIPQGAIKTGVAKWTISGNNIIASATDYSLGGESTSPSGVLSTGFHAGVVYTSDIDQPSSEDPRFTDATRLEALKGYYPVEMSFYRGNFIDSAGDIWSTCYVGNAGINGEWWDDGMNGVELGNVDADGGGSGKQVCVMAVNSSGTTLCQNIVYSDCTTEYQLNPFPPNESISYTLGATTQLNFTPVQLNEAGAVVGHSSGTDYETGYWRDVGGQTHTLLGPQVYPYAINAATQMVGGVVTPAYQIVGYGYNSTANTYLGLIAEMNPSTASFDAPCSLDDLLPPQSGWSYSWGSWINNNGAIVGIATYTPPTLLPGQSPPANQPAAGQHGVMLAPCDYAPAVLKVNSSFNEWKVNSTTGYAQPDNYDENLTIASGPNQGQLATTNLHQNFFGIKPGTMPASFYQNATVTITKLDLPDAEDGLTYEPGTVRLYAIQNVGQNGATSYPIPISLPGQPSLPNSSVPFATSISTDQPANLVPVLYSANATIPQGSNVTYWMEGVDPGPITLEYRIHFTSGSTPDVVVDQHFLVCTQQSKAAWQQDIRQEILVQTSQQGTTGVVDMNSYVVANGFMANRTYVQCVYGYYQELFDERPDDFYWAGLAKLAGGPVYAGLSDMQWGETSSTALTALNVLVPTLTTAECTYLQRALLDGNYNIFSDLAWQFRAYQASGIWALQYTSENGLDVINSSDEAINLPYWQDMFNGDYQSDSSLILKANLELTNREQEIIVQPAWKEIAADPLGVGSFLFSNLAISPVDYQNDDSFLEVVPDGNITIFTDNRWTWITDPDYGIWHDWTSLLPQDQSSIVDIPLTTRAASYSYFSYFSRGVFPIW